MVLVDSSAWIEGIRRTGDLAVKLALEGLLEAYEAQWCSPVRLELLGGVRKEERQRLGRHFAAIPTGPPGRTTGSERSPSPGVFATADWRFLGSTS